MSILVEKPGIFTTVQDLGRYGYQRYGVNPSGAMDRFAAECAALLVGGSRTDAVLEMHFPAPRLVFQTRALFSLTGADFSARLDDRPLSVWHSYRAEVGSVLSFDQKLSGSRCYLDIGAGLTSAEWLGSQSTNLTAGLGGFAGRRLEAGDVIDFREGGSGLPELAIAPSIIPKYHVFPTLRAIRGAEYARVDAEGQAAFETATFDISPSSNRMGFRLAGPSIRLEGDIQMLSSAVTFGTVQLLPDGQLILLMADHQTAGGYPRIAHVVSTDLPLAAQLGPSDRVAFHLIDVDEAEGLARQRARDLRFLEVGCRLHSKG